MDGGTGLRLLPAPAARGDPAGSAAFARRADPLPAGVYAVARRGSGGVTDFLGITDSKDSKNTATSPSLSTNGLVDSTLATQTQNAQNFYNSTQSRQINDNKTIYINTTASAQEVAQVIASNSYSYAD